MVYVLLYVSVYVLLYVSVYVLLYVSVYVLLYVLVLCIIVVQVYRVTALLGTATGNFLMGGRVIERCSTSKSIYPYISNHIYMDLPSSDFLFLAPISMSIWILVGRLCRLFIILEVYGSSNAYCKSTLHICNTTHSLTHSLTHTLTHSGSQQSCRRCLWVPHCSSIWWLLPNL